jgi:hypothetical protein
MISTIKKMDLEKKVLHFHRVEKEHAQLLNQHRILNLIKHTSLISSK